MSRRPAGRWDDEVCAYATRLRALGDDSAASRVLASRFRDHEMGLVAAQLLEALTGHLPEDGDDCAAVAEDYRRIARALLRAYVAGSGGTP